MEETAGTTEAAADTALTETSADSISDGMEAFEDDGEGSETAFDDEAFESPSSLYDNEMGKGRGGEMLV